MSDLTFKQKRGSVYQFATVRYNPNAITRANMEDFTDAILKANKVRVNEITILPDPNWFADYTLGFSNGTRGNYDQQFSVPKAHGYVDYPSYFS